MTSTPVSLMRNDAPGWAESPNILVLVLLCVIFVVVLLRTAWVSDDAYITFRVMDNFVSGYGLRWNVDERVWCFTNTLWLFALTPIYYFTREAFYTSLVVSIVLSSFVFWVLVQRLSVNWLRGVVVGLILLSSKAFIDYSTSGLENPLTNLLLLAFFVLLLRPEKNPRQLSLLALIAGCAYLNRPDAIVLLLPALGWLLITHRSWKTVLAFLAGFSPVIVWEVFALVYYGFPFPNTAYAKLGSIISRKALLEQGAYYFLSSLDWDPLTLVVIGVGVVLAFISRRRPLILLGLGIVLHLFFVLGVGGDFMNGRFFTATFLSAAMIVCQWPYGSALNEILLAAFILAWGLHAPSVSPLLSTSSYIDPKSPVSIDMRSIADERRHYYAGSSLLQASQQSGQPALGVAETGRGLRRQSAGKKIQYQIGVIGMAGYFAGPNVHFMDTMALADAFLARMPMYRVRFFRPGHIRRQMPEEYGRSLDSGKNEFRNPATARLYEAIGCVTRAPLFSGRRLREIIKFNTGQYQSTMDEVARYYGNGVNELFFTNVSAPLAEGTGWNNPDTSAIGPGGLAIKFDTVQSAAMIETTLSEDNRYKFQFFKGSDNIGSIQTEVSGTGKGTGKNRLQLVRLTLPPEVKAKGFDLIRIDPLEALGRHALGHLVVVKDEKAKPDDKPGLHQARLSKG